MNRSYRTYPGRLLRPPRGMCKWCGLLIRKVDGDIDRKKTFCGPECVTHFQLRADPQKMRQHIFFRDQGKCAACGFEHPYLDGEWEADHIKPLMMAFASPDFWEPDNVALLCITPCHKEKSARDLRQFQRKLRRKVSRILREIDDAGM